MKKLLIIMFISFITIHAFSDVFPDSESLCDNFWKTGSCIKIIEDKNNISYISKTFITGISIDEDDMKIATSGYNVWTGKNDATEIFRTFRWNFSSDSDGNIVISKK